MAATAQTLSTLNSVLKEKWFKEAFSQALYDGNILLERLAKKKAMIEGRYYLCPIHKQRNFGVGPRLGTLGSGVGATPTPGSQGYDAAQFSRKHYTGRARITGSAISAAQRGGSVSEIVKTEMKGLVDDIKREMQIDCYGDGTGTLAITSTSGSSTTHVLNTTRYLSEGQPIVFGSSVGAITDSSTNARTITAIDHDTKTITVNSAINASGGSITYIYRQGVTTTTADAYGNAIDGLLSLFSTTNTYGNINRSTAGNSWWKPSSISGAAGLSIDLMTQAMQTANSKANGKPSLILTSNTHYRQYGNLIQPDRRWDGMQKTLDGGYLSLPFQNIPIVSDPDCPDGYMFMIDESTLTWGVESDLAVVEQGDGAMWLYDSDYDLWTTTAWWRGNLMCNNPAKSVVITNLPV